MQSGDSLPDDSFNLHPIVWQKTTHSQNSYQLPHCVIDMAHQQYLFGKTSKLIKCFKLLQYFRWNFKGVIALLSILWF